MPGSFQTGRIYLSFHPSYSAVVLFSLLLSCLTCVTSKVIIMLHFGFDFKLFNLFCAQGFGNEILNLTWVLISCMKSRFWGIHLKQRWRSHSVLGMYLYSNRPIYHGNETLFHIENQMSFISLNTGQMHNPLEIM